MVSIPIKILVVDDEEDFVEMLSLRLKEKGDQVFTASNGSDCLNHLDKQSIDVVILDLKMPGMDGIETLKQIKARHPLVEVIMLTGHGTAETAVDGMKLGAFDYLIKPSDFDTLTQKLDAARQRKDDQEERIRQAEAKLLLRRSGVI
jgi:DNA-binding NtrC family response regulator